MARLHKLLLTAGLAALLAAAVLSTAAVGHAGITAQVRAAVVLSAVLDVPVVSWGVELLTSEPRIEERSVAGVRTVTFNPAGEGPNPTIVFVNGAVPRGPEEPAVVGLSEGLARAGYRVLVPDLTGLREGAITEDTAVATAEVTRAAAEDPGTEHGQVGLFGVSVGASLAILAAGDPEAGEDAVVVSGLAPYADLENVVRLAATDTYLNPLQEEEGPFEYHPRQFLGLVVARSLAHELPEEDREALLSELPPVEEYQPPEGDPPQEGVPDPLNAVRELSPEDFGPEARSLIQLLSNENPERFDELYAELPQDLRERIRELSPIARAAEIETRLELASGPRDEYFPPSESRWIAREAPNATTTVTPALFHAGAELSLENIQGFLELNGFVVRVLQAVATGEAESTQTPPESPAADLADPTVGASAGDPASQAPPAAEPALEHDKSPDLRSRLVYHRGTDPDGQPRRGYESEVRG